MFVWLLLGNLWCLGFYRNVVNYEKTVLYNPVILIVTSNGKIKTRLCTILNSIYKLCTKLQIARGLDLGTTQIVLPLLGGTWYTHGTATRGIQRTYCVLAWNRSVLLRQHRENPTRWENTWSSDQSWAAKLYRCITCNISDRYPAVWLNFVSSKDCAERRNG